MIFIFTGFTEDDFQTFNIDGLNERMSAIQKRIQPKFKVIGEVLSGDLSILVENEMFLHIAKHARRTVNPPNDTWLAVCHHKRGYKKHPHFQIGLYDDHLFIWLAFIYEAPNKRQIAQTLLDHVEMVRKSIPDDYVISTDHTKKAASEIATMNDDDFKGALLRFRDVKSAELLIGKHYQKNDPILKNGPLFLDEAKKVMEELIPIYKLSMK